MVDPLPLKNGAVRFNVHADFLRLLDNAFYELNDTIYCFC